MNTETAITKSVNWSCIKELTKPQLLTSVILTSLMGYTLALLGTPPSVFEMIFLSIGVYLVGSGAHAFNQFLEIKSDSLMERTKNRPLPSGRLEKGDAIFIGLGCSLAGYVTLFLVFNPLTAFMAMLNLVLYVFAYTPLKRISAWNTWFGAIPGAMPTLIGWVAVQNYLSLEVFWLFGVLAFWQIPHFLALAWKYKEDYVKGQLKMLTGIDKKGYLTAVVSIIHTLIMILMSYGLLKAFPSLGNFYFFFVAIFGMLFLITNIIFVFVPSSKNAMRVFIASIVYLPLFLLVSMIDLTII